MPATINVTYHGFNEEAKAAFEYAKNIWAALLNSSVPILIDATYRDTNLNGGLMGMCVPNGAINSPGAEAEIWYVSALADALASADQNVGYSDMDIQFSPDYNWYFGLDGHPGAGQYDFVTVVLHEICHGLGFVGLCNVDIDDSEGSYSMITADQVGYFFTPSFPFPDLQGNPSIFYRNYLLTPPEPSLTNIGYFPNPSLNLKGVYTGGAGSVYVSHVLPEYQIYTPDPFVFGSSMDHFSNYLSLMYYSVGLNAIHTPEPEVLDVLNHLGWNIVIP